MSSVWIGIDTGGTFTDLVLVDLDSGAYSYYKLPTTPHDPSEGILDGIRAILEQSGCAADRVGLLCHGTTLATNAVLEGNWARTGLITTEGFADVLELARQRRPHFFNLDVPKPTPPALRDARLEVRERLAEEGSVVTPLNTDDVERAIDKLKADGIEAVAVCFLHSYANSAHELKVRDTIAERWPEAYVCVSSELLGEFREYERMATATVNASLMPIVDRYLERFEESAAALGIKVGLRVMQSNGGAVSAHVVRRAPVNTFFSGPAGGVIGAIGLSADAGRGNLITFDMGGTSTDVCLVRDGVPARKNQRDMAGFPVRTRTLDLHTIGAGGGSIAWVDPGGLLKVGPKSAGANPGPASYGRGGTLPAVTDANVVLGRLNPKALLKGRMPVYADRAHDAITNELTEQLGMDVIKAASGILEIVNINMMGAVRVISVERGEDPRDFTLVPFGGAGPLHAADIARAMGIREVLVPAHPGLLSAIGLIHADLRGEFSLTRLTVADGKALDSLVAGINHLESQARGWIEEEGQASTDAERIWLAEMRYLGQNFELPITFDGKLDKSTLAELVARFHAEHDQAYGYKLDDQPVEIVNLRLSVVIPRNPPPAERPRSEGRTLDDARVDTRPVWFQETGFVDTPVYDRDLIPANSDFQGPAIVEQMDTTTVVPPSADVKVDQTGNLIMTLAPLDAASAQNQTEGA